MICFTKDAWEHYIYWQETDKNRLNRINSQIKDCLKNPFDGIGKPEPLRREISEFWSKRIDECYRFIYKYKNTSYKTL